jgi:hypothetical protein
VHKATTIETTPEKNTENLVDKYTNPQKMLKQLGIDTAARRIEKW